MINDQKFEIHFFYQFRKTSESSISFVVYLFIVLEIKFILDVCINNKYIFFISTYLIDDFREIGFGGKNGVSENPFFRVVPSFFEC